MTTFFGLNKAVAGAGAGNPLGAHSSPNLMCTIVSLTEFFFELLVDYAYL